tara:strand:+ start:3248 stop:3655 length:408 start_codon:yes stop_codon:yes gene_type:complete
MKSSTSNFSVVAAAICLAGVLSMPAALAGEKKASAVERLMLQRNTQICRETLKAWMASPDGVKNPGVVSLVTDCYVGRARLYLNTGKVQGLTQSRSLSEVPARLLAEQTGVDLDPFSPLVGVSLVASPQAKEAAQ